MTDLDSLDSVLSDDVDTDLESELLDQDEGHEGDDDTTGDKSDTEAPPAEETQPTDKSDAGKKPDEDTDESWTKRAVLDERRKRQDLEREVAELRAKLKPDVAPKQPSRPDIFEDQEGAFRHVESTIEQRLLTDRITLSQELMREKHEDYDEIETEFVGLVAADPSLIQKMSGAALPAKFVVDHVKKHRQMQELQDVDGYKAKLKAEVRAELMAELEAERAADDEADANATQRKPIPPQLVTRRSADKQPIGHESLEDLFDGR